jgi:hypothetical protein
MSNTELAKDSPAVGPLTVHGYVTCEGGVGTVRTQFAEVYNVQLTQKVGVDAHAVPPTFDFYRADGAQTVYIYSNNQAQGDDVVYYMIAGRL